MNNGDLAELFGVFVGGATPWLEAIVVIPIGIAAGLPPVAVVLAGASGNVLTVAIAAFFGERVRRWWQHRRGPRPRRPEGAERSRRSRWMARVFDRWGLAGLAVLGPLGLGTQLSAVVAVGFGHSARRTFTWIAAGTVAWCIVVALLASFGSEVVGLGGR